MSSRKTAIISALGALFVVAVVPSVVGANPLEPPWIYEVVQDGENVEVTIRHTYLNVGLEGPGPGEEELTLVRYSEDDGSLRVLFERRLFSRDSDGVQCDDWYCPEHDEDGCAADPDSCFDCDDDDTPECPVGEACVSNGCESVEIDDCVPPGSQTYGIYVWQGGEYVNCDWDEHLEVFQVEDVGQDCPVHEDTFECVDLPGGSGDELEPGGGGCSTLPSRAAGGMTALMLLIGLGGFLFSRIRRRR